MADSPYTVLEIAPTLDLAAIKRGYFAALAKSPPHADPGGFRRLREAYEQLTDASSRTLAFLRAPIDDAGELTSFESRWGERIARESAAALSARQTARNVDRFIKHISSLSLDQVRGASGRQP